MTSRPPWIGPAAVAVVCALGVAWAELDPVPAAADPADVVAEAPAGVVALLGGLRPGERIVGWTVLAITGPDERRIRIDFERDAVRFSITIALLGALPQSPPMQTDRYAIYYGHATPEDARLPNGAVRAILADVARRLRASEAADVPDGLGFFPAGPEGPTRRSRPAKPGFAHEP